MGQAPEYERRLGHDIIVGYVASYGELVGTLLSAHAISEARDRIEPN